MRASIVPGWAGPPHFATKLARQPVLTWPAWAASLPNNVQAGSVVFSSTDPMRTMPDDNKHTERVPVNLTEREFLDVCREAGRLDMKPGEFVRFLVRRSIYGSIGMTAECGNTLRGSE